MSEKLNYLLTGIIIGGMAGIVTGILIAPRSGKEMRENISGASEEAVRRIKELKSALMNKAENAEISDPGVTSAAG